MSLPQYAVPMDQQEPRYTVSEILDRFQRDYVPSLSPRTQKDYARHCRDLKRHFGHFIADDLKPRDFREFMDVRRGKIQRNKQLAVLSCAYSEAVGRWYMCDRNPCRDVKRHPSRPRDREVTDAEFEGFMATVPFRMRLAMQLSVATGQRQGDILSLRWDQVDKLALKIRFKQAKTGKRLAVRITPYMRDLLVQCMEMAPDGPYVIRRRDGDRYTSDGFRAIWQRYQRRWAKAGNERFTYHDLRARAAAKCRSIEEAMLLLGHQNISMTRRVYDRAERVVDPSA
jgi:integrase